MINPSLSGGNPAASKARIIARDFQAKQASREYDRYCAQQGIPEAEAQLLAPANVKHGKTLRLKEARQAEREAFKKQKEAMGRKFGNQRSAS
jgi:hypothetical protein